MEIREYLSAADERKLKADGHFVKRYFIRRIDRDGNVSVENRVLILLRLRRSEK